MNIFFLWFHLIIIFASIAIWIIAFVVGIRRTIEEKRLKKKRENEFKKLYTIFFTTYMFDNNDYKDRYIEGWNDAVDEVYEKLTNRRY